MALYSPKRVGGTFVIPRLQPIGDPDLRPPAAATWQLLIGQPQVTWQPRQHRSTPVNAACHRSTAAVHGGDQRSTPSVSGGQRRRPPVNDGDRRSMVAVNDGRRWRTTVDCRWTTVDHHRSTVVGGLVNDRFWAGLDRVWARSGSGLDRVWVGSGPWHATCQPRGIHVAADVDIKH
nr:hypothetical protein [Tanacetum cinerariifolium]